MSQGATDKIEDNLAAYSPEKEGELLESVGRIGWHYSQNKKELISTSTLSHKAAEQLVALFNDIRLESYITALPIYMRLNQVDYAVVVNAEDAKRVFQVHDIPLLIAPFKELHGLKIPPISPHLEESVQAINPDLLLLESFNKFKWEHIGNFLYSTCPLDKDSVPKYINLLGKYSLEAERADAPQHLARRDERYILKLKAKEVEECKKDYPAFAFEVVSKASNHPPRKNFGEHLRPNNIRDNNLLSSMGICKDDSPLNFYSLKKLGWNQIGNFIYSQTSLDIPTATKCMDLLEGHDVGAKIVDSSIGQERPHALKLDAEKARQFFKSEGIELIVHNSRTRYVVPKDLTHGR